MINEKFSNIRQLSLGIEGEIKWPNECMLCGCGDFKNVMIIQTESSVIGGSIGSKTISYPLCGNCSSEYYKRVTKYNLYMNLSFLLGLIGCILSGVLGNKYGGYDNLWIVALAVPSVVLIIASAVFMKIKAAAFPIKVELRTKGFMVPVPVIVLKFKTNQQYERMFKVNS